MLFLLTLKISIPAAISLSIKWGSVYCRSILDLLVEIPKSKENSNSQNNILGVRPEKMFLSDNKGIPGEIYGSEYLGTRKILTIQSLFGTYKVRVSNDVNLKIGSNVKINFESESAIIFDNETDKALLSEFIN